jgi:hypothetical protein
MMIDCRCRSKIKILNRCQKAQRREVARRKENGWRKTSEWRYRAMRETV